MANLEVSGFNELDDLFNRLSAIPDSVAENMLMAGAEIVADKQRSYAASKLGRKGRGEGITADSIVSKMEKGGRSAKIYFKGTRPNGKKRKRTAEVAFIHEYGAPKKGIPATHFVSDAVDDSADKAHDAMAQKYNEWFNDIAK